MRLTCPNCAARYDVPDAEIPETGRDVRCAACGTAWVQHRSERATGAAPPGPESGSAAGSAGDAAPHPPAEGAAAAPEAAPARRGLDPEIIDILRQEAARERAARAAESTGAIAGAGSSGRREAQPDPGLSDALSAPGTPAADPAPAPGKEPAHAARQGGVPDPAAITSSLSPSRARADQTPPPLAYPTALPERRGGGFRAGFVVVVLLCALAAGVYVAAPDIARRFPAAEAPLARYVALVDTARVALADVVDGVISRIGGA